MSNVTGFAAVPYSQLKHRRTFRNRRSFVSDCQERWKICWKLSGRLMSANESPASACSTDAYTLLRKFDFVLKKTVTFYNGWNQQGKPTGYEWIWRRQLQAIACLTTYIRDIGQNSALILQTFVQGCNFPEVNRFLLNGAIIICSWTLHGDSPSFKRGCGSITNLQGFRKLNRSNKLDGLDRTKETLKDWRFLLIYPLRFAVTN